jgi:hypothetical protein
MVRRRWLIAQVALLGMLGVLAFPGASSALLPQFVVTLTSTGPSPAVVNEPVGYPPVWFTNTDTVTHSVVFANGSCSIQVAPDSREQCSGSFASYIGDYDYTVDGTTQGQVVVEPIGRSVSLFARRHSISRGSELRLHGRLQDLHYPSPPNAGSPQPILVLSCTNQCHTFHRIAVVRATLHPRTKSAPLGKLLWQLRVRPRATTVYIAEAVYQPRGGRVWEQAWSKPFRVRVRR